MRGAEVGGLATRQLKNNTTTASPKKTVAMARVVALLEHGLILLCPEISISKFVVLVAVGNGNAM
jgi:hypothetical protein